MAETLKVMIDKDNDKRVAINFATQILGLLRDYIPQACQNDVFNLLASASLEQKFELTSFTMRKEYEAWKSIQIDILALKP